MRFPVTLLVAVVWLGWSASPLLAQSPTKGPAEKLFNGKNFAGWQKFAGDKRVDVHKLIYTDPFDKHIILTGTAPGYLVTEKAFGNYELSLEWRWHVDHETYAKPSAMPTRKSGVLFHIAGEADVIWPKSIKAQLAFDRAGDLQLLKDFKLTLSPERLDPKNANTYLRSHDSVEKPLGEWNQCVITCHGPFVSVSINSTLVMTARGAGVTKGRIALQSEAGEIHFRDITMKKLEGKPVDPEKDD